MPGFTRLENDTDLTVLLALPVGLVKPYLFLLSRANLNEPCVSWEDVSLACGLKRRQTFDALSGLQTRGLAVRKTALWQCNKPHSKSEENQVSSAENRTRKIRRVQKTALRSAINRTEECNKPHSKVQKTALRPPENTVLNGTNDVSKEVEQKNRTEEEQKNNNVSTPRSPAEPTAKVELELEPEITAKPTREPTEWQRMFGAVGLACYQTDRGLAGRPLKLTSDTAKALIAMKVTPEEVPRILEWIGVHEAWRSTITPADLQTAAPRWRAQTNNPASTPPSRTRVFSGNQISSPARDLSRDLNNVDYWAQAARDEEEFYQQIGVNRE